VLAPRIEQEPRAGLDDDPEPRGPEQVADAMNFLARGGERIEVVPVEGQRDTVVPERGEDRDDVGQPVVREAVGVVPEAERRSQRLTTGV
jgi:hypothetical protein